MSKRFRSHSDLKSGRAAMFRRPPGTRLRIISPPPIPGFGAKPMRSGQVRSRSWVLMVTFNVSHFFFSDKQKFMGQVLVDPLCDISL